MINEREQAKDTIMSFNLKEPKFLIEIADFALQKNQYATNAIAELLEQLYNMDSHCLLVVVDEYNYMFKPTGLPSFRYANDP